MALEKVNTFGMSMPFAEQGGASMLLIDYINARVINRAHISYL